ncbi:GIY-YIG nuclease family protein [Streptomyces yunnanensis]|uniref:GIY-YIG catalytic domain-containing protein n=1 Tax=Streptomyces yunnanensis TaxID=156453 RepID=A0A9X8MT49_9ACTN|nr:GIY-YIG nuclease family protein [Streptomyces yunnanensis]SHL73996.1 GIY-YIG catalytic domain-containing protein [Streptomyces yunnanensis]
MKREGRTALYRVFDAAGKLLYIGISQNPDVRFGQHSQTKPWWPEVAERRVEWHDTRAEAAKTEKEAIRAEQPYWNLHHIVRPLGDSESEKLCGEYREALEEVRFLRPIVTELAVAELRKGATAAQLSAATGMTPEVFRRLAREHDIPVAEKYQSRADLFRARTAADKQTDDA